PKLLFDRTNVEILRKIAKYA
ncbi:hypothetical protein BVZ80_01190B, partial [Haemophilus influenzae]